MSEIERRLESLGLHLPAPIRLPPGASLPFPWVRIHKDRAYCSGHGPLERDGSLARPLGKVGRDVTLEQARHAAGLTALAMLASLKAALGDLDRVGGWLRVFGMVNADPGFDDYPLVINGFTELVVEVFGEERGRHSRSAVGMAGLPFGMPVEIEAEVALWE